VKKRKYKTAQENETLPYLKPARSLVIRRYMVVFTNAIGAKIRILDTLYTI